MGTSIFLIPYIASFKDAEKTREYLNFQSSIHYCEEELRVLKERAKLPEHIKLVEKNKGGKLWRSNLSNKVYYGTPSISIEGIGKDSYRKLETK